MQTTWACCAAHSAHGLKINWQTCCAWAAEKPDTVSYLFPDLECSETSMQKVIHGRLGQSFTLTEVACSRSQDRILWYQFCHVSTLVLVFPVSLGNVAGVTSSERATTGLPWTGMCSTLLQISDSIRFLEFPVVQLAVWCSRHSCCVITYTHDMCIVCLCTYGLLIDTHKDSNIYVYILIYTYTWNFHSLPVRAYILETSTPRSDIHVYMPLYIDTWDAWNFHPRLTLTRNRNFHPRCLSYCLCQITSWPRDLARSSLLVACLCARAIRSTVPGFWAVRATLAREEQPPGSTADRNASSVT